MVVLLIHFLAVVCHALPLVLAILDLEASLLVEDVPVRELYRMKVASDLRVSLYAAIALQLEVTGAYERLSVLLVLPVEG